MSEPQTSYRQRVLERIVAALGADQRLTGLVLIGSGADGFTDDDSDIDLIAVVSTDDDPVEMVDACGQVLAAHLNVAQRIATGANPLL